MKYMITISYDGSKYHGLQKLKNENTIQGELERVLEVCDEQPVKVISSGRTDRGVHAINQVCSFELQKNIEPYKLKGYLNRSTSPYLFVKSCEYIFDENFHARFSVKKKTYKYIINIGPYDPIKNDYVFNYNKPLNIDKMKEAASILIGPHNYRAFVIGKHETCDSIIDSIEIVKTSEMLEIYIKGKAFYTYMVRNIISILVLVGNGILQITDIAKMLETGKKVIEYSPAPASGLYLYELEY